MNDTLLLLYGEDDLVAAERLAPEAFDGTVVVFDPAGEVQATVPAHDPVAVDTLAERFAHVAPAKAD